MANQTADTSITKLLTLAIKSGLDPNSFKQLNKALKRLIPIVKKRRILMPDSNLNKTFRIKRINHIVIVKVLTAFENMYTAQIISVEGQSFNKVGDELSISKRELEITGHITSSKS